MRSDSAPDRHDALLRELEESGLSMAEFCRRRGLVYSSVAAWRSAARRRAKSRQFVELIPTDTAPSPRSTASVTEALPRRLAAEMLLPGGIFLRIYADGHDSVAGGRG